MKYFKNENNEIFAYERVEDNMNRYILITEEEKDTILAQKQEDAFNTLSYQEKRASEYPPMTDYLDAIVKGDETQKQEYINKCLAVKDKYPKGE